MPPYVSSSGTEAVEVARMAGLEPDPWQEFVIHSALGERADHRWSAFEVGVEVARQNGKGGILEMRELAGLFVLGERLIIHSAHEFATAIEALERMAVLLESCPDFDRRVQKITRSHGFEGIHLKGGQRLKYKTRTKTGGRGFSGDCLILDEAMDIPEAMHAALFPILSARPNPQIWYTGSAVDQESMEHGVVFSRVRERGIRGDDPRLAYFGWSPDFDNPDMVDSASAMDPEVWAQANPAMGTRITAEYIEAEQRSLGARGFAVERLGVGDWPATDDNPDRKITDEAWRACEDEKSVPLDPVCFAFDVTPDRSYATIATAGRRKDGKPHVEVIEMARGTAWVARRLKDLTDAHESVGVLWGEGSPAASLVAGIEAAGVPLTPVKTNDHAKACGLLFDAVDQRTIRHLGTTELALALRGAVVRAHGDAWIWSRKSSAVNISPLVACTLALWGLSNPGAGPPKFDLADFRIRST